MSIAGQLVVDGVVHAFDNRPENCRVHFAELHNEGNFGAQEAWLPEAYRLSREEYFRAFDAATVGSALFYESPTDIAVYHSVGCWGVWADNSPLSVGLEMRERHPGRVFCYGAVSPGDGPKALEQLHDLVETSKIQGLKLYPLDFIDGELQEYAMSDEERIYPILETCRKLNIKTVGIHKAIPLMGVPMDAFRPGDVDYAAMDFPDLNFEIVHAGFAFLEESAFQLARFPNVYANLEGNSAIILTQPRTFAKMIGEFLKWGGEDKVIWATGAMAFHPAPLVTAFWNFTMPPDMVQDYGYPELTDEIKAKILGKNWARMHGLDPDSLSASVADDATSETREREVREPWSELRSLSATGAVG